jgi:site-specific DNA-cytosine methylase
MWILPKQLHTSPFVPDTAALISDSTEQSEICAQSLLARSKPSPARTWSQRWKRDSWTAHLSGRILKPSHGPSFVTAWTSSLAATRASHLAQPANDSEPKTHDTSGHISAGIAAMRPSVCFFENVEGHISLGLSDVLQDLAGLGYRATWCVASASECGAPHQRKRVFILAYDQRQRIEELGWQIAVGSQQHSAWLGTMAVMAGFQRHGAGLESSGLGIGNTQGSNRTNLPNLGRMWCIKHGQAAPASSSSLGSRQGLWTWANASRRRKRERRWRRCSPRMEPQRCLGNERIARLRAASWCCNHRRSISRSRWCRIGQRLEPTRGTERERRMATQRRMGFRWGCRRGNGAPQQPATTRAAEATSSGNTRS